jgi:hypothetical protein
MNLPKITPIMLRNYPDQTTEILNNLMAEVKKLQTEINKMDDRITALENKPDPVIPDYELHQIVVFDPTAMGSDPGWCLRNVDRGFGIYTGTYASAREDMEAQAANGTLHAEMPPPDWLQVPVYVDTGTVNGHVVVWDRGTVWSDGAIVPDGLAHYSTIYGWGEKCDNVRVVGKSQD